MSESLTTISENSSEDPLIAPELLRPLAEKLQHVKDEVRRVFIGPEEIINCLVIALCSKGHILLEGVPGVAKTTLVRTFARTLGTDFSRIQFTPDLLPSDITGSYIPNLQTHEFVFRKGPIFSNVVLGDEINRAPARTQSALLEAMQERQVTVEGVTHPLNSPFIVLATQNPVEYEGVYRLPEAQLDRFMIKVRVDYPSFEDEVRVLKTHKQSTHEVGNVLSPEEIVVLQEMVEQVHVSEALMQYIVRLLRYTREHPQITLGASPRAGLSLMRASRARAILEGRNYVLPDDIKVLAPYVLSHRLVLHPEAEYRDISQSEIVRYALKKVSYA